VLPCEATEVAGDALWRCDLDATGRALAACHEERACTVQERQDCLAHPDSEEGCLCTAGDGRLHVWAIAGEVNGANTCFLFGHTRSESGVDLAVFRTLLKSFLANPP
jgi:hypothetical protein